MASSQAANRASAREGETRVLAEAPRWLPSPRPTMNAATISAIE